MLMLLCGDNFNKLIKFCFPVMSEMTGNKLKPKPKRKQNKTKQNETELKLCT